MIYSSELTVSDNIFTTDLISQEELDKWPGIQTRMLGHLYEVNKVGSGIVSYFAYMDVASNTEAEQKLMELITNQKEKP